MRVLYKLIHWFNQFRQHPNGKAKADHVPVVDTLDHILKWLNANLIKIDVDGYEAEVLAGAASTLPLSGLQAVIVELNNFGSVFIVQMRQFGLSKLITFITINSAYQVGI